MFRYFKHDFSLSRFNIFSYVKLNINSLCSRAAIFVFQVFLSLEIL